MFENAGTIFFVVGALIVLVGLFVVFAIFASYFRLWIQSYLTDAEISILDLLGMTFRKVPPSVIVRGKIMAITAGVDCETITTKALEAHYLAGGNVPLVLRALVAANKAKTIQLSFREATAIDLVGYSHHAGGLDQVVTILWELAEKIDPDKLVAVAKTAPVTWAQRLGYLLERVEADEKARALRDFVKYATRQTVPLLPGAKGKKGPRDPDWKLFVNVDVEADL